MQEIKVRVQPYAYLVCWGCCSEEEGVHCAAGRYEQPGRQDAHDWRQNWLQGPAPHVCACDPVSSQLCVDKARVDGYSRINSVPYVPGRATMTGSIQVEHSCASCYPA